MTLAPHTLFGTPGEDFDQQSLAQLQAACSLPVSAGGALMPDAHVGYGLPIGGVLATRGCVIPYAVGVDIACRVKLSVFDLPAGELEHEGGRDRLKKAIEQQTAFGVGATFGHRGSRTPRREHEVMDDPRWDENKLLKSLIDKAHAQLGTSGSGNHFVEFGVLSLDTHDSDLGLDAGQYLALLSHSGSRGPGSMICNHYSKLAMEKHPELEGAQKHLAWLDLESEEGDAYWTAMSLMGNYASANHACIHQHIARHLGARVISGVENHHNFAWKEQHDFGSGPEDVVVHRKGATPAGRGVLGVIPGTMASSCYVVRGKGGEGSLDSAAHGAGRAMSRGEAKRTFNWNQVKGDLEAASVTLLSAGIDENPRVYKNIETVMARQDLLVEPIAVFSPRLVKMSPDGERAED